MPERLANELIDAGQQQGEAYKRKDDIYRMAQANKAFAWLNRPHPVIPASLHADPPWSKSRSHQRSAPAKVNVANCDSFWS
jgi:hypothetical protein